MPLKSYKICSKIFEHDCKTKSRTKDLATFVMPSNKVIVFVSFVKTAMANVATTAFVAMAKMSI